MEYCLDVARVAQRFEPGEWPDGKWCEGEGPAVWGDRVCGLACLMMILAHFRQPVPTKYALVRQAVRHGAFTNQGIAHQALADLAAHRGIAATPTAVDSTISLRHLLRSCGPVVASITHQFPEDGRRGGHLVVIAGIHSTPATVTFRDPSRWGAMHSVVSLERFLASFSGRAVAFAPDAETLARGFATLPESLPRAGW